MESYLVPFENAESAFEEKRSRFISHLYRGKLKRRQGRASMK